MGNKIRLLHSRRLITVQTMFDLRHAMWVYTCMEQWCPAPFELRECVSSNQRLVDRRICNEVAGFESRPGLLRKFAPSIPPGSVNEYQLRLRRQRQLRLISIADERVGVQVTVKPLENTWHTWALLRRCFTTKRRYIKCMHLYCSLLLFTIFWPCAVNICQHVNTSTVLLPYTGYYAETWSL